jgi:hypothetical protein
MATDQEYALLAEDAYEKSGANAINLARAMLVPR